MPDETDSALRFVRGRPTPRERSVPRWHIGLAAMTTVAAALAAVVVMSREDHASLRPASTPTTTLFDLGDEFSVSPFSLHGNFDGDGGACFGVAIDRRGTQSGCLTGDLVSTQPVAYARVGNVVIGIGPGENPSELRTVTAGSDDPEVTCFVPSLDSSNDPERPPALSIVLACVDGVAVVGRLDPDPDVPIVWVVDDGDPTTPEVTLERTWPSSEPAEVFTAAPTVGAGTRCILVTTGDITDGWRESCFDLSPIDGFIAGTPENPVQVDLVSGVVRDARDLDSGYALSSNGCATPIGEILANVPDGAALVRLQCSGLQPVVIGTSTVMLHPSSGGANFWMIGQSRAVEDLGGPELDCGGAQRDDCAVLGLATGDFPLPIPPGGLYAQLDGEANGNQLWPIDVTDRFDDLDGFVDGYELTAAVLDRLREELPESTFTLGPTNTNPTFVVIDNVGDDAAARLTFVIWAEKSPDQVRVGAAYQIVTCRGEVVTEEGGMPLCV